MMEPAFKLLTEEKKELEIKNEELKEKSENLAVENKTLFGENAELKTRIENSIKNVIEKNRIDQIDISQTKEMIQNIRVYDIKND